MLGEIIKGKPVADKLTENIKNEVEILNKNDVAPMLAMVRVGNSEDDLAYQRGAVNRCEKAGIQYNIVELDENISQSDYIKEIENLNANDKVHGILCFRPLPKQLDENEIKHIIKPEKDVDCFNPLNLAMLLENEGEGFLPCTAMSVMEILKFYNVDLKGKKVVVLGRSLVIGKPLALMMINENATVTVCHSKTKNLKEEVMNAEIVVSCMGRAKMIDETYIKEGAVVIDVGINFEDGKLCGDVDFENVKNKVKMITPVPGGVGSTTTSILANNVITACKNMNKN